MDKKSDIINKINDIKNVKIADLKENVVGNSNGNNYLALAKYNAMLDNITIGPHTVTNIEFVGIDWQLRLLGSDEFIKIQKEIINIAKEEDMIEDFYIHYLTVIKILSKALTPSPFKTEGVTVFSENDLKLVNYDVLEELYRRYIDFVDMATKKPQDFTDKEVQELIALVKKKPETLTGFDRSRLLIVSKYLLIYSQKLEKIIESEPTN